LSTIPARFSDRGVVGDLSGMATAFFEPMGLSFTVKQVYEFGQSNFWNHLRKKRPYRDFRKQFDIPGDFGSVGIATAKAFETIYNKLRALEPARRKEIAELPQEEALAALEKVTAVHIGQVRFIDGVFRPVFQDGDRQYVIDAMGTPFMACGCRKG